MALNLFIKIDGIKGHSTSAQAKDHIELLSFSTGVSMPTTAGQASGMSVKHGRADFQDFTFSKYADMTSPVLAQHCSAGNNIKDMHVTLFVADEVAGEPVPFYTIQMDDCILTSVSCGGGSGDFPIETVTVRFNKIIWTHHTQGKDAKSGDKGKVSTGWCLETNKKV